nr:uncharacterized protein LOC129279971 [Lytechinus pictus]XP_054772008.1 uncharacterized protein LOC129279971 [Lytechinus pictus]
MENAFPGFMMDDCEDGKYLDDKNFEPEAFPPIEDDCMYCFDYIDTGLDVDDEDDDEDGREDASEDGASEQWSKELHSYKPGDFVGPTPGPTSTLEAAANELDFFYLMFPPSLIEHLTQETNQFAEQQRITNPDIPSWKPLSVDEMKVFLGMRIFMSIPFPHELAFWDSSNPLGTICMADVMSMERFRDISVNFCVNDEKKQPPEGDANYDKLYEIRPVINEVLAKCLLEYNSHQSCLIHASHISDNPGSVRRRKPFNMEVLMRSDSVSGYCCEFLVYVGEVNHENEDDEPQPEKRFPSRMVLDLCQKLKGLNHIITMSSYFTSPKLIKTLLSMDILARGTVARKLKGFPNTLLSQTRVVKQGESAVAQQGSMSAYAYAWQNRDVINLISTADDPIAVSSLEWERRGKKRAVPYPGVLKEYNKCMGRMEKLDRSRIECSTARVSSRWWVYLFWCVFDIAILNAFVLMRDSKAHQRSAPNGKRKTLKMFKFRQNLSKQLMDHKEHVGEK